jgi:hypothetical protein
MTLPYSSHLIVTEMVQNATRSHIFSEIQKRTVENSLAFLQFQAKLWRSSKTILFLLTLRFCFVRLGSGNGGQHFIESLLRCHLFGFAFILAVFMLAAAGAAARLEHFFTHHGNNGMVRGALAARTVIVNIITQSHGKFSLRLL